MMISVLTNDLSDTGRADRDNYVQWLRFLWESYRACLEVRSIKTIPAQHLKQILSPRET